MRWPDNVWSSLMPKTVNEKLQDASISHTVNLQQLTNGIVSRMAVVLGRSEDDLLRLIRDALDREPRATAFSVARLDDLLSSARSLNREAYTTMGREFGDELKKFNDYELGYQQRLLESVLPTGLHFSVTTVSADQVYAAALARPFQGRLLNEWLDDLSETRATRVRDAIRMGFVENETNDQIIRRIRGTRANRFQDGILQMSRRDAEAMVRTAVSHVAGVARDNIHAANDDIIKAEIWHSTLDMHTTSQCQIRDGKQYTPVDHKPMGHAVPWLAGPGRLHWRCRSTSYPLVKSWEELGFKADELSAGTRASMDGQVPEDLSYGDWLKQQPASRQDQILGASRGKLMRSGGLAFDSFYSNRGDLLTLDELRAREAKAFRKAGLD